MTRRHTGALLSTNTSPRLGGKRVVLRPLNVGDWEQWREVRSASHDWVTQWEPAKNPNQPNPDTDKRAFRQRCGYLSQQRRLGNLFDFGVFVEDNFIGEMNMSSVTMHPFYSCFVGYWIDKRHAGQGYAPEALVAVMRFAFEELGLYRVQVAIVKRNNASLRVVEKLGIPYEGLLRKFLEINGIWEDHSSFAMTLEDWEAEGQELVATWLGG